MKLKQKLFIYSFNLMFSLVTLWAMLVILNLSDLKPEIIIRFFFIFFLLLSLILFRQQYSIFLKSSPRLLKYMIAGNFFWLVLLIGGIFLDIFIFKFVSDYVILGLLLLSIMLIRYYKFGGRVPVGIALGFLILTPFLLILGLNIIAEKTANWAYMFLAIGIIQMFVENVKYIKSLKD